MNKNPKKTKIVCTIGPSSWNAPVLKQMIAAGMNVARINGAFADVAELERVEKMIREISDDVALMLDIKGHQLRLNKFTDFAIKPGDTVEIGSTKEHEIFPITFPALYKDVPVGSVLLIDDGNIEVMVKSKKSDGTMVCEVLQGSTFKSGKSINTPGIHISNPPLTERDVEQMKYCAGRGWEFIAASFIRTREDAEAVIKHLKGTCTQVIAKIEDQEGIDNIDDIMEVVDGVMVARGDLAVEIPFERIPLIQKQLIWKSNAVGKPVITATQMLESMVNNPRPTRAEITDVANAVIDGSDAVMLSAESSTGKYPVVAVETLTRISQEMENNLPPENVFDYAQTSLLTDALTKAVFQLASQLGEELKSVIVITEEGESARLLGRFRLVQPIYAFVSSDIYRRQLVLTRGITQGFTFSNRSMSRDTAIANVMRQVIDRKLANKSDKVLIFGGGVEQSEYFPNVLEVVKVGDYA